MGVCRLPFFPSRSSGLRAIARSHPAFHRPTQGLNQPRHAQGRYARTCPKDHHATPARRILTRPMERHGWEVSLGRTPSNSFNRIPGACRGLVPHGDSGFRRRRGPSHPKIPAEAGIHFRPMDTCLRRCRRKRNTASPAYAGVYGGWDLRPQPPWILTVVRNAKQRVRDG